MIFFPPVLTIIASVLEEAVPTVCQGAVSRTSKGIEVDAVICAECCACVAVCPTGALQYQRFPDREFFKYCRGIPLRPGTNLVIGSESSLHKLWWRSRPGPRSDLLFVEYPKVQALSFVHLLFLFALGARRIILLDHAGEGRWAGPQGLQVRQANAILECLLTSLTGSSSPPWRILTAISVPVPPPR